MNLKLVAAICVLAATPTLAQQGAAPPAGPKPTKADAQKVVQIISSDKAKMATYCEMAKLDDQMPDAYAKKDQKKIDALEKQSEALSQKLGPEYAALTTGLQQLDPASPETKDFATILEALDKLCK
jgi:hypothetical protein